MPPGPVAFRRAGIGFLGHPAPAGALRLPHGRPTESPRTPSGLPRCPRARSDRDGCPLYSGGAVPTRPSQAIRPSLAASQRPTPVPRCCFHLPRAWDNGASSRVHSRSPVRSSPLPVAPGWTGSPWASPPGFTPRRYQRRMPKWGRALGHLPGITSPASTSPPRRIHSPRGPSCRTPADLSSSIPPGLTALRHADPLRPAEAPHLLGYLATVTDPRTRAGRRHPLVAILVLAAAAVLAGARSIAAIAEWAADAPQPVRAALASPPRSSHRPLGVGGAERNHDSPHPWPA